MTDSRPHRGYIATIMQCRCPRCREGKLFRHTLTFRLNRNTDMHDTCPACGQPTDIEIGFYYGTGYISYLVAILITILYFLFWLLTIGFSFNDQRFLIWIISNSVFLVVLQPWLMRFSRVLWLSFFINYDREWELHQPETPERINAGQMNNW